MQKLKRTLFGHKFQMRTKLTLPCVALSIKIMRIWVSTKSMLILSLDAMNISEPDWSRFEILTERENGRATGAMEIRNGRLT